MKRRSLKNTLYSNTINFKYQFDKAEGYILHAHFNVKLGRLAKRVVTSGVIVFFFPTR